MEQGAVSRVGGRQIFLREGILGGGTKDPPGGQGPSTAVRDAPATSLAEVRVEARGGVRTTTSSWRDTLWSNYVGTQPTHGEGGILRNNGYGE